MPRAIPHNARSLHLRPLDRWSTLTLASCLALVLTALAPQANAATFRAVNKSPGSPVTCTAASVTTVRDQVIDTEGPAVEVAGPCLVTVEGSVLLSDDVAILVRGNGTVRVIDSFVQGRHSAVRIEGNGTVVYESSTFRGAMAVPGNGTLQDLGDSTVEVIPTGASPAASEVRCSGRSTVSVVDREVDTEGSPLVAESGCSLLISDSLLLGNGGLAVAPGAEVRLRNAVVEGTITVAAGGRLHVAGSALWKTLDIADGATFVDGGGNQFGPQGEGGRAPSARRSTSVTTERPAADDVRGGLATAFEVLQGLAGDAQNLADAALPAPGRDAQEPLVRHWRVTEAWIDDQPLDASGSLYLYRGGTGVQNYQVRLPAGNLPQLGAFTWQRQGSSVRVEAGGTEMVWQLLERPSDRLRIATNLGDGPRVELVLEEAP